MVGFYVNKSESKLFKSQEFYFNVLILLIFLADKILGRKLKLFRIYAFNVVFSIEQEKNICSIKYIV